MYLPSALVTLSLKFLPLCFLLSDCLGRRIGPRLLGRVDDSEVSGFFRRLIFSIFSYCEFIYLMFLLLQRLARDFYKILNEVSTQEIPDGLKLPNSFSQLVSDMKNNHYDAKTFALVLRAMVRFV